MPDPVIVSIDPGANGGIAWLQGSRYWACSMPEEPDLLYSILVKVCTIPKGVPIHIIIEEVGGYLPQRDNKEERDNRQPGHTMFNFGQGCGMLKMGVKCITGYFPQEIRPQEWQKYYYTYSGTMNILPRKRKKEGKKTVWLETENQFKGRLKNLAQRLFPKLKVTLQTSDALLMGLWKQKTLR